MVSFQQVPNNLRIPFAAVEFNAQNATQGPALLPYSGLLIGQKLNTGSAAQDTVVQCVSVADAITKAGRGSMLHRMAIGWFASNESTPLWLGVLADASGGVQATGTIVVTGPATATGTIALYLGGVRLAIGVNIGDAAATIATNIAAAITAALDLPVTAGATTATVTITFRHKGVVGNTYDVRANFNAGEVLPTGVGLTITALGAVVAGTSNPPLTNLIAAMASLWTQVWAHPYTDATSLTASETELVARSGPMRQQQAIAITSASGSFSTLTTLGVGRNSPNSSIVAQDGQAPLTPPMEFAAEVAALVAFYGAQDPARPFQTLAMSNAIGGAITDQWPPLERNQFLFSGISTTKAVVGGGVQLDRMITTYETSPSGAADVSYLDVTTMLTLLYLRYSFATRFQTKYPRHKLADDGTRFGSGQAVITPMLAAAEAVTWFDDMMDLGLVEDPDEFKNNLVVVRNSQDQNRLDFLLPPNLINGLIVVAAQIQFLL